jgi:hypothetical protein
VTNCTTDVPDLKAVKKRKIEVNFGGGAVTSDGGALLLRQVDEKLGLTKRCASAIDDGRRKKSCDHSVLDMIRQRVFGIALGYEDLNDNDTLRKDPAFQTAANVVDNLASPATLSRFENSIDRQTIVGLHEVIIDTFIASFKKAPKELVLDFDATDDRVHGEQEGRHFSGFYDHYCFMPLYVFCGEQLLVSYLRPGWSHAAHHSLAILSLLVEKLRAKWPRVKIIFRGDSGFMKPSILHWCDEHSVDYIVGIAKNSRLIDLAEEVIHRAKKRFKKTGKKVRYFTSVSYAAKTWDRERRVVVKAEHTDQGENPRFVGTSLKGSAKYLYEKVYCARGDMENRIKEQLHLFADRTSSSKWYANQFRVMLSSIAYVLLEALRRIGLKGTKYAKAQCQTIRLKLLKVGGVITRNTRRIRFALSSYFPGKQVFLLALARLSPD